MPNEQGAAVTSGCSYFYETWWFRLAAWVAASAWWPRPPGRSSCADAAEDARSGATTGRSKRDRARIAQDIHDDLGAGLTQIMLLSELARRDPVRKSKVILAKFRIWRAA